MPFREEAGTGSREGLVTLGMLAKKRFLCAGNKGEEHPVLRMKSSPLLYSPSTTTTTPAMTTKLGRLFPTAGNRLGCPEGFIHPTTASSAGITLREMQVYEPGETLGDVRDNIHKIQDC